ncbi:alpha/beta hydrolase [Leifsonia sp. AG29]|uniref:alpha/beta hydrolase n=1 Tax=Leifsonia sp. AG29 TaxID=2598860 RepID=UPI00131AC79F|nr:alpha/beta hydrolase-fold protein [Leifsonia sp. AG29]
MRLARRTLIGAGIGVAALGVLGAGTALAVEERLLPGRSTLHEILGLDGAPGRIPSIAPGPALDGSFVSAARLGATCRWTVSFPPGSKPGDALPVLVALHGYGGDHSSAFGSGLGLDRFLAQAIATGVKPFAIASVDGGNTYWHRRASGEDAGAMVTEEFLPLLARSGLDVSRVSLFGWSMGGYGALHLAGLLGTARVASVVAESPAIWHTVQEAAHTAFDDSADFAANTVFGREAALARVPVRIDCGTGDGFYPNVQDYVAGLRPRPAGGFEPGGHNNDFWRRVAPAQLAFVGRHLP